MALRGGTTLLRAGARLTGLRATARWTVPASRTTWPAAAMAAAAAPAPAASSATASAFAGASSLALALDSHGDIAPGRVVEEAVVGREKGGGGGGGEGEGKEKEAKAKVVDGVELAEGAKDVFVEVMRRLRTKFAGDGRFVLPKEITFLNGAPGAGKSVNSRFMLQARGLNSRPVVMSDLLAGDKEARRKMDEGRLISDVDVVEALFRELLKEEYRQGVLVDGFPRTAVQADCLALLRCEMKAWRRTEMEALRKSGRGGIGCLLFPVPRFFVCILHVSREQSVQRQLRRGVEAREHNARLRDLAGPGNVATGDLMAERKTDGDTALLAERYAVFERHRDTLTKLQKHFPFKVLDASMPIDDVRASILCEFQYQSKNDLSRTAFDAIQPVVLASRVGSNARPALCQRLDEYVSFYPERFDLAVALVTRSVVPRMRDAVFAGQAIVRFPPESPEHDLLSRSFGGAPFRQMVLDCLAERGYASYYDADVQQVPVRFDTRTGVVETKSRVSHVFHVTFPKAVLSVSPNGNVRAFEERREHHEPENVK